MMKLLQKNRKYCTSTTVSATCEHVKTSLTELHLNHHTLSVILSTPDFPAMSK